MSNGPVIPLIAALVAGTAGAFGAVALMPSDGPAEDPNASRALQVVESLRTEVARMADDQADLRAELQRMDLRLSTTPSGGSEPQAMPLEGTDPVVRELQEQVAQLRMQVGGGDTGEPMVIETVSAALEEIREQEEMEAAELRAEARQERQAERLGELTDRLDLDSYQVSRLEGVMADYGASSDEIVQGARKANDWGGMRSKFDTLNGTVNETLATFLKPDQLDEFAALGGPRILTGDGWWGRMNDTSKKDDKETSGS